MATHVTDYNQNAEQIVLDLVNADNNLVGGAALTLSQVTLGTPTVLGSGPRNTSVVVTAIPGQGRQGSVGVTYNRVDIADVVDDPVFDGVGLSTLAELIPAINARFGVLLESGDYTPQTFPGGEVDPGDADFTVELAIVAANLVFHGTVDITVTSSGGIPADARLLENGDVRILENGDFRILES